MAFTKADLQAEIRTNLGDPAKLSDTDLVQAIDQAVTAYSRLRPRQKIKDYSTSGSAFDFAVPTDFQEDFSVVKSIEYPQGDQIPVYLKQTEWIFYRDGTNLNIRFLSTPIGGKTIRVIYTVPHIVGRDTGTGTTVVDADKDALTYLATARAAAQLAGEAARQARNSSMDIPLLPGDRLPGAGPGVSEDVL